MKVTARQLTHAIRESLLHYESRYDKLEKQLANIGVVVHGCKEESRRSPKAAVDIEDDLIKLVVLINKASAVADRLEMIANHGAEE